MAPRKGQKNRFPLNTILAIRTNVDEQLARALAQDKVYNSKAKKLKRLEAKVQKSVAIKFSQRFSHSTNMVS